MPGFVERRAESPVVVGARHEQIELAHGSRVLVGRLDGRGPHLMEHQLEPRLVHVLAVEQRREVAVARIAKQDADVGAVAPDPSCRPEFARVRQRKPEQDAVDPPADVPLTTSTPTLESVSSFNNRYTPRPRTARKSSFATPLM